MILISINGEKKNVAANTSLADVLAELNCKKNTFAVAVNKSFIPRDSYQDTILRNGDDVDVVTPMQGG